jgi:hypothetical protein
VLLYLTTLLRREKREKGKKEGREGGEESINILEL